MSCCIGPVAAFGYSAAEDAQAELSRRLPLPQIEGAEREVGDTEMLRGAKVDGVKRANAEVFGDVSRCAPHSFVGVHHRHAVEVVFEDFLSPTQRDTLE